MKNVCCLTYCPHCNRESWVLLGFSFDDLGSHLTNKTEEVCYRCSKKFKFDKSKFKIKSEKKFSIEEYLSVKQEEFYSTRRVLVERVRRIDISKVL